MFSSHTAVAILAKVLQSSDVNAEELLCLTMVMVRLQGGGGGEGEGGDGEGGRGGEGEGGLRGGGEGEGGGGLGGGSGGEGDGGTGGEGGEGGGGEGGGDGARGGLGDGGGGDGGMGEGGRGGGGGGGEQVTTNDVLAPDCWLSAARLSPHDSPMTCTITRMAEGLAKALKSVATSVALPVVAETLTAPGLADWQWKTVARLFPRSAPLTSVASWPQLACVRLSVGEYRVTTRG